MNVDTRSLNEIANDVEEKMTYMCGCLNCISTVRNIILKSKWKPNTSKLKEFSFRKVSVVLKPLYMFLIPWVSRRLRCFLFLLTPLAQRGNFTDVRTEMEKAMAPHSSTLAWKIPWMEEPGRLQSVGSLELDTTEQFHFHFSLSCIGEGNGNPL